MLLKNLVHFENKKIKKKVNYENSMIHISPQIGLRGVLKYHLEKYFFTAYLCFIKMRKMYNNKIIKNHAGRLKSID